MGEVAQCLMSGVEQPELHQLIRGDVGDDLHAHVLESRPAAGEIVLEYPLGEGFGHHRPRVCDPGALSNLAGQLGGSGRGDAVHHGIREPRVFVDPRRQLRIA